MVFGHHMAQSAQMKPEPVPLGTLKTFRVQRSRTRWRVLMNTTEVLACLNISIVFRSSATSSPRAVTARGSNVMPIR